MLLPPSCPPASTAPREGLHGGACSRALVRRGLRRVMRNLLHVGTYNTSLLLNMKHSSESGVEKNFDCAETITDKRSMICDVSIIHSLMITYRTSTARCSIDSLQHTCTSTYSSCVPGLLVDTRISRNTSRAFLRKHWMDTYVSNELFTHSCENPDTGRDTTLTTTVCVISRGEYHHKNILSMTQPRRHQY